MNEEKDEIKGGVPTNVPYGLQFPFSMREETEEALTRQKEKHFTILNYLINKNSHPLPRGMDYKGLLEDIEDFEKYLSDI